MFDKNEFKRKVKEWVRAHPQGSEQELLDYCDDMIPPQQFAAHQWLVQQTLSWYRHILDNRSKNKQWLEDGDEVV